MLKVQNALDKCVVLSHTFSIHRLIYCLVESSPWEIPGGASLSSWLELTSWFWIPLHSPCPQSLNLRVPIRRRPPVSSMPHQYLPMTIFSSPLAPEFPTGSSLPLLTPPPALYIAFPVALLCVSA